MEAYDFIQEMLIPIFKGDYQDFSSKKVEGYSLFISEYKKPHVQAMVRADIIELLQNIEIKYKEAIKGEVSLNKSLISRWYVNGFTDLYNGCRRKDISHPHEQLDYLTLANKLKPVEDLHSGKWNKDKFRKYTINLGRYEGVLFYVAERETILFTCESPKEEDKVPLDNEESSKEVELVSSPSPSNDLSKIPSFQPTSDDGLDLKRLYGFLRNSGIITEADESLFIQYVTHAHFIPLYQNGNKVNIRYTIAQLKAYYDKGWLKAVCKNLNITEKYITQRPPSETFRKEFPSLKLQK